MIITAASSLGFSLCPGISRRGTRSLLAKKRFFSRPCSGSSAAPSSRPSPSSRAGSGDGRKGGLLLFGGLVGVTMGLGAWQLQRSVWKRDLVEAQRQRLVLEPIELTSVGTSHSPHAMRGRRVQIQGRYDHSRELLLGLRGPPKDALPDNGPGGMAVRPTGYYVLTPLVRADGSTVLVNRGWVTREAAVGGKPEWPRPTGKVEVVGVVSEGEKASTFTPSNDSKSKALLWVELPHIASRLGCADANLLYVESILPDGSTADEWPIAKREIHFLEPHITPQTHLMYAATWFTLGACSAALTYFRFRSPRGGGGSMVAAAAVNPHKRQGLSGQ